MTVREKRSGWVLEGPGLISLVALYLGTYYGSLSGVAHIAEEIRPGTVWPRRVPEYRFLQPVSTMVFYPLHQIGPPPAAGCVGDPDVDVTRGRLVPCAASLPTEPRRRPRPGGRPALVSGPRANYTLGLCRFRQKSGSRGQNPARTFLLPAGR
jgi:hypothetical protein